MSGSYVSLVMQGVRGVDPSAKLIAAALADCANPKHHGIAFPSVAVLMDRTGLSERSVQGHLRELVHAGWIEPIGATHGGRGMATRYKLNLPKMRAEAHKKGAAHCAVSDAEKGAAGCAVSGAVNPAAQRQNPAAQRIKTPQPAAPEPKGTVIDRAKWPTAVTLQQALNPIKKELKGEPENGADQSGSEPDWLLKQGHRTQAEQIAWIKAQIAAKVKP